MIVPFPDIDQLADRVVDRFGAVVGEQAPVNPSAARRLLLAGFKAKRFQTRHLPERRQLPYGRLASKIALEDMVAPLANPASSVLTSVFFPTEIFRAAGLLPYAAEAVSGFVAAAHAEERFVAEAEAAGVAETYCSFHKVLIGASLMGVIEPPALIASCSLACDANSLTFKALAGVFDVERVFVDVPHEPSDEAVGYVADQLRELAALLARRGTPVDDALLAEYVARSERTLASLWRGLPARRGRDLANTLGQEMQSALDCHLSMGTPQAERMALQIEADMASAAAYKGLNIVWLHTTPFYQAPLQEVFDANPDCQLIASDMCFDARPMAAGASGPVVPACDVLADDAGRACDPYRTMAHRLVYNAFNGPAARRIDNALELARTTQADGVVVFCQWGCKHTLGMAQLAKRSLEEAGFPTLVLEGDGCNRANTSDGQVTTRMGAFIELLKGLKEGVR